jgi:hypothetical protein
MTFPGAATRLLEKTAFCRPAWQYTIRQSSASGTHRDESFKAVLREIEVGRRSIQSYVEITLFSSMNLVPLLP